VAVKIPLVNYRLFGIIQIPTPNKFDIGSGRVGSYRNIYYIMSTSNTSLDTQDQEVICNLLSQRGRFLSLLTPSARYTPVSPYPNYTKAQLDMRRKVEILQYKKNTTQLYQTTKSQKWSQLANANSNRYIICNKNPYVPSPSSACDVPGPLVYLTYDPAVPLYNYATSQNSYSTFYTDPNDIWNFILNPDISGGQMVHSTETETPPYKLIGTLMIQNTNDPMTNYKFTFPIGLYVNGTTIGTPSGNTILAKISNITLNIYFNYYNSTASSGSDTSVSNATPYMTIPITNSLTNTNIYDLSMSLIPTVVGGDFSASQFIGDIIVPNIELKTAYGFLYDFRLYVELQYVPINDATINSVSLGVYANIPQYDTMSNGCIVTPQNLELLSKYLPCSLV